MKKYLLFLLAVSLSFAARSQAAWTIGAEKGYSVIDGEVSPLSGFAFGFFAEKHFGRVLSARLQWGMGDMRGQDRLPTENWVNHPVWNGSVNEAINYQFADARFIYPNYQTNYMEGSLQGIFTLSQLPFLRNESPFDFYLLAGISAMRYQTRIDAAFGGDIIYEFSLLNDQAGETRPRALANLSSFQDGEFETAVQDQPSMAPMYQAGAGVRWKIRDRLMLSLSHRVSFTNTDALDSYQWDAANDRHHYTSLSLGYAISRKPKSAAPEVLPTPLPIPEASPEFETVAIPLSSSDEDVVRRAFDNLEFETNQAIIRPGSFASLNELATLLSEHPDWKLSITGHTDDVGEEAFNMDLSKRRAEAVRDYLAGRGISAARFYLSWYGESRPVADNRTKEGRQRNRRVEMRIVE
jgi:outer membrane protein OmpA-like peptidoglycan-associated protein